MKQPFLKISLLVALLLPFLSFSQDKQEKKEKKNQVRIRVERDIDGKKEVFEKKIDASHMTEQQREAAIQKVQDSLMADTKGKQRGLRIEIEDEDLRSGERYERDRGDRYEGDRNHVYSFKRSPKNNNFRYKYYNEDRNDGNENTKERNREWSGSDNREWGRNWNLDRDMGDLGHTLKKMGDDIPNLMDKQIMVWNNSGTDRSSTIRGVEVYPNNPKTEILNINFSTAAKGDVSIRVLDVKGNILAKEEVKDFQGEYVGQLNIGKSDKGTYFVMVTQNEDGIMKRVVIP